MSTAFKKTSSNGKLSIYLGKREFVDESDTVEPIDGVILVDQEYLKGRKMFVMLTCAFRYGCDDLDVIGLTFRKDLYVQAKQVAPAEPTSVQGPLTALQEQLLRKLEANAQPFTLQMVANLPSSVTLKPGPEDSGKPCGVDFELKSFCAENLDEKIPKKPQINKKQSRFSQWASLQSFGLQNIKDSRHSLREDFPHPIPDDSVQKVQFSPLEPGPGPWAQTIRSFLLSAQPLQLQAWMDREVHYHGEAISVHVSINNYTNKIVKSIKIAVLQVTDVVLYSLDKYTQTVFIQEFT